MESFTLESPPEIKRPHRGRGASERVKAGVTFAIENPNTWFVFVSQTFTPTVEGDENKVRSRVTGRCNALRAEAKRRGVNLKVSTRKVNDEIKAYAQSVTEDSK